MLTEDLIKELYTYPTPSEDHKQVLKCMLILLNDEKENFSWLDCCTLLRNPDFKSKLQNFDLNNLEQEKFDRIHPISSEPTFNFETQKKNGGCTALLTEIITKVVEYYPLYQGFQPLKEQEESMKKQMMENDEAMKKQFSAF